MIQKERREKGPVPVVIVTHDAKEENVQSALREIDKLDVVNAETVLIRIEKGKEKKER